MGRKIILYFIAALFLLFAYFQHNDPDGLVWLIFYVLIAFLAILNAMKRNKQWYFIPLVLFTMAYMVVLAPGTMQWINDGMPSITASMKAESPYVENVREFLGLLIALIAQIGLFIDFKRHKSRWA